MGSKLIEMKQSTPQINAKRPLSSPQKEIWRDQILHPDSLLYTIGGYVQIDGPVDVMRFAQALEHVIQQNDSLRSVLIPDEPLKRTGHSRDEPNDACKPFRNS
jgi:hypothetical protein